MANAPETDVEVRMRAIMENNLPGPWASDHIVTAPAVGPQGATGPTGAAGPQGATGATGATLYTWIAYANNSTGTSGFTTGANTGQAYIGIANNKTTATESSTPSDYTWSLIKGTDGVPGTPGADGTTTYTWFAYASNSTGTANFTNGTPSAIHTYVGIAANKTTATESTTASDYTWSLIKGADGAPGATGATGAPGATGANGQTTYAHYAYANSPDGAVDFDINSPNGRAYVGTYTDFTAADSTNPASYSWSAYAGPSFGMATRGNAVVAATSVIKNGGVYDWTSDAFSTVGFRNGAQTSFRLIGSNIMAGLNTDPLTDASYTSIDFAFYRAGTTAVAYESGGSPQSFGTINDNTTYQIRYTGTNVVYLIDGAVVRTVPVASNILFYFDSSLYDPGCRILDIGFNGAGADGAPGATGSPGVNAKSMTLSAASVIFNCTYLGVTYSVQYPKTFIVTTTDGATSTSPTLTLTLSDTTNIAASVSGGVVSITKADIDGYIDVSASGYPTRRMPISRNFDSKPAESITSVNTSINGGVPAGSGASSYFGGPSVTTSLLKASPSGQLVYSGYAEYSLDAPPSGVRRCVLKAQTYYRVAGSGSGYSTYGSSVNGTQAETLLTGDATPGMISFGGTKTGLTAGVLYEVGVEFQRVSTAGSVTGSITGDATLSQT